MKSICPFCSFAFDVSAEQVGRTLVCPSCHKTFDAFNIGETMELIPPGTREVRPKTTVFGPRSPVGSAVGKHFQEYQIVEELGRGGMGVVYKAMQETLQRLVALKLILAGEYASEEGIENFLREAITAAKLRHPNIVTVYELDVHEGIYYYTMDYIEGKDLSKLISDRGMEPRRAAIIALKVARALNHAHQKGVVHRDLKPGNIIVGEQGEPMVTDFGMAFDLKRFGRQGLALAGTPLYMAPEQLAGNRALVGPHSDIYALGVLLFEMLIGQPPFEGKSLNELLDAISKRESPDPRQRRPDLDEKIADVCLKCLHKKPEERYRSAAELAEELASWLMQKHG